MIEATVLKYPALVAVPGAPDAPVTTSVNASPTASVPTMVKVIPLSSAADKMVMGWPILSPDV